MEFFADYAEILIAGGGIPRLLDKIQKEAGVRVAWKEYWTGTTFSTGEGGFSERAAIYPLSELIRIYCSFEVEVKNKAVGRLLLDLDKKKLKESDFALNLKTKNGIAALKLFYSQKMEADRLKSHYYNEFVQDLLYNRIYHEEELKNRAGGFHWNSDGGVICTIILANENFELWDLIRSRIKSLFPFSIFAEVPNSTVFLLSPKSQIADKKRMYTQLEELLSVLCRDLEQRTSDRVLIAVGTYYENALRASLSYQEARQAMMILESNATQNAFAFWDQLGGTRLIASLADTEPAKEFCRQTLAPLLEKHSKNKSLIQTLLCVEESGGNLRMAAQRLSLHYNSVKYRMGMLWDLLEISPQNAEQRFNLSLALRIYKILKGNL